MKRLFAVTALALLLPLAAHANCTKDTDCKGTRVCEAGSCVTPSVPVQPDHAAPVAPVAQPAAAPAWGATRGAVPYAQPSFGAPQYGVATRAAQPPRRPKGYATIAGQVVAQGWGGVTLGNRTSDTLSESTRGGLHLGGFYAFNEIFHLGGYLSFSSSELPGSLNNGVHDFLSETDISFGLTTKLGGGISERIWLGFVLEGGGVINGDFIGGQGFAGGELQFLAADNDGFRFSLYSRIGGQIQYMVNSSVDDLSAWRARLMLHFGLSFGS